jgi:hypothetical protein
VPSRFRLASISAKIAFLDSPRRSARVHAAVHLGGDHHLVAARVVEQRLADDLLAGAVGVDVGGVEEVDAEVERLPDERPARGLAHRPRVVAAVGRAEAHAAEAEAGNLEAGAAEAGGRHGLHGCECASLSLDSSAAQRLRSSGDRRPRAMPSRRRIPMKFLHRAAAALAALVVSGVAARPIPDRPITLIVPWGAGGGTDATARIIGTLLEKELKQPINVVNRTGGSGVVGHSAIAQSPADGYTIGLITVEIGMMHWQGLTELKGSSYTPLGLVNADPPACRCAPTRRTRR